MTAGLEMWTVYESPSDFQGLWVVRRWVAEPGGLVRDPDPWFVGATLEAARESLPPDLYRQGRQPDDDPTIVEIWF